MATRTKPRAREAFDLNILDAEMLVALAGMLRNQRRYAMRSELRERVGSALKIPKRRWDQMECIENEQVFITFKPGSAELRGKLTDENLRPLLRQALVAACAAVETFVADRVMELMSDALKATPVPPRLLELSMTVDAYLDIERRYERRAWGLRQIIEDEVRRRASPAPAQIGVLFALVDQRSLWKRVDQRRNTASGMSETTLQRIVSRRNVIAHTGDRKGRGRAAITLDELQQDLTAVADIVDALDRVTKR